MTKKILTISLLTFLALLLAATPAMASNGKNYHSKVKTEKSDVVYDIADENDNAHPSGKDRSIEHGHSFSQGKAKSDPDNNGKGPDRLNTGLDKPGKGGGIDKYDQDGNNGCGNDDDFEDDNEGWCGHKPKKEKVEEPNCPEEPENPETPEEPEQPEEPTPEVGTPEFTPTVLTISQLPNTANGSENNYSWILVATTLVLAGAGVHLAAKKYEEIF